MNEKLEELKAVVHNEIGRHSKSKPINLAKLCDEVGLSSRETKEVISELRNDYPIVAKEVQGGGYWIAEDEDDIVEFIQLLQRRIDGHQNTIKKMNAFLADYGNIPTLD